MMPDHHPLSLTVGAECLLCGAPLEVVTTIKKRLTLPNPKFLAARKYSRWVGKKFPQHLYFYKERKAGLSTPRGLAREVVLTCLEKGGVRPEIIDQRRSLPEENFHFHGRLRDYQEEAVRDVMGRDFGVLEAGTGSGKTVMALAAVAHRRQPALIIVHTKELLYQWAARIEEFLHLKAGLIGDGKFKPGPVTVAIVNTARRHLDELRPLFGHILVDECHRVPASLFTDVITAFDAKFSLGLTATAYRREDVMTKLIYFYLGPPVHRVDNLRLQKNGAVARPKIILRPTVFTYNYCDDYPAMMSALTLNDDRNRLISSDVIKESKRGGICLVVSDRVDHCLRLAELIREQGGEPAVLTGRTNAFRRNEIVEALQDNQIKILIATVQLIGEGFDAPGLSSLFLATPIKFSGRVLQTVGRVMRPAKNKKALVYDYLDPVGVLEASARVRQRIYTENFGPLKLYPPNKTTAES